MLNNSKGLMLSSANAPHAKDDAASTGENTAILINALVNDKGGNAKSLHSLDQDNLLISSVSGVSALGAAISISGGMIEYDPGTAFDYLANGESVDDTFEYAIQLGNGTVSIGSVTVTVNGADDLPVLDLDAFVHVVTSPGLLLTNDGSGSFTGSIVASGSDIGIGMALGDVDGDGDLDVVLTKYGGVDQLLRNDGSGNFVATPLDGVARVSRDVSLGDLDGDGDLDALILFFTDIYANSGVQLLVNDGSGSYTSSLLNLPFAEGGYDIELADLDGDGDLDAVATTNWVSFMLTNDGSGNFTSSTLNAVGYGIAIGDIDGDTDLDILLADGSSGRLLVNDGNGNFTYSNLGIFGAIDYTLGDVDGDGDLDALSVAANVITLLTNDGDGNFSASGIPGGTGPSWHISLGDLDGDGDLDGLVANNSATGVQLLINDGDGNFAASSVADAGVANVHLALGDLDGDGTAPIVDANGLPYLGDPALLPSIYVVI